MQEKCFSFSILCVCTCAGFFFYLKVFSFLVHIVNSQIFLYNTLSLPMYISTVFIAKTPPLTTRAFQYRMPSSNPGSSKILLELLLMSLIMWYTLSVNGDINWTAARTLEIISISVPPNVLKFQSILMRFLKCSLPPFPLVSLPEAIAFIVYTWNNCSLLSLIFRLSC